eukprot:3212013-Rhodomonas_salina.1
MRVQVQVWPGSGSGPGACKCQWSQGRGVLVTVGHGVADGQLRAAHTIRQSSAPHTSVTRLRIGDSGRHVTWPQ